MYTAQETVGKVWVETLVISVHSATTCHLLGAPSTASCAFAQALVDERTCAMLVNSPSNPCGAVYSREHLEEVSRNVGQTGGRSWGGCNGGGL
jgi:aspartate/methionine/tyrosine aminotransferase